ncbi:c2h2 finger and ankyrin domain protein [Niveomyces insectorum RCEF 264]|uniref:C2h2 finger and ankyrin domain protein n=1 Tax=Niveomyces insectorum RCEF 264 TaxID=1081102 RepID=A0A167VCE9_9HYPO|nr:c2h2 finger and ankyrin domain protein [Niveomyces insectorum RCEF 264]
MDKKDELLKRPLYLYSLPADILDTLAAKDLADTATHSSSAAPAADETAETRATPAPSAAPNAGAAAAAPLGGQACALCGLSFATVVDQRGHLKSDLHNYNLKQKLRGLPPVTEPEFERLVDNLDESLSGSDSSSESESGDESRDDGNGPDPGNGNGNVLATLLKKQAVLAEKRRQTAQKGDTLEDGDVGSGQRSKDRTAADAAAASLQPFVWFTSPVLPEHHYFGVYRALFTKEELEGAGEGEGEGAGEGENADHTTRRRDLVTAIRTRQLPPISGAVPAAPATYTGRHVFLCMIGGGHFAAMVVALAPRRAKAGSVPMHREAIVLAHKTFHRYTTRRKQGGSQSANDAAKGAAHSAGSSLRRYNEQALVEDVRALLRDWQRLLDTADLLFVRATGTTNQRTLFGPYEGQVLRPRDPRLRGFPFNTRRPTQKEIMRAFIELTRLKVREIVPRAAAAPRPEPSTSASAAQSRKDAQPKRSEEEETALLHTAQLQALARRSKVPALLAYLQANQLAAAHFRFAPPNAPQHHHAPTLLHLAASQNAPALVTGLLLRAGADPTVQNGDGKTPFELAGDRATRDAFRVARGKLASAAGAGAGAGAGTGTSDDSNAAIDWDAARVPSALTQAEAEQRDAREKEENARQEATRRQAEEARLQAEAKAGAKAAEAAARSTAAARRKATVAGVPKTAQEIRVEETRGLTPEQRQRLERERRARAAEERMRRMQQGGGGG